MRKTATVTVLLAMALALSALPGGATPSSVRSLDGGGNNLRHPDWGQANTQYRRVAQPAYGDGIHEPATGPDPRYVSNRIFNDVGQNLFSENGVTQWGWAWGQFLDHTFGLRDETPAEHTPIPFAAGDPLERFKNDLGVIDFFRTPAAPGTGISRPREQINTVSSYIDAFNVYGGTPARLDWLREGSADGNPDNNGAKLLLTNDGYLPQVNARGSVPAPAMDLMGALMAAPGNAIVAGDVRANENIALTALHTLFAREHNRIVAALPRRLSDEEKFQIARRVVGAEIQYVTYNEFLPAMGVRLPPYRGYDDGVDASLSNEFAVVGYRAHSQIHGEFEPVVPVGAYSPSQLASFQAQGIAVEDNGDNTLTLVIPLNTAFGNPGLLHALGLGPVLQSLGEVQYRNDEQIDDSLRSVLFQMPKPGAADPASCAQPIVNPNCFRGVADLGAIDIQRGRDHGIPGYNELRKAYGLAPKRSFTDITGESTDRFPSGRQIDRRDRIDRFRPDRRIDRRDPFDLPSDARIDRDPIDRLPSDGRIDRRDPIDDPDILDVVELRDDAGKVVPLDSDEASEDAVVGIRRTTLAARLRAIYGSVDKLDAFVGMVSEQHVRGTEFGELQLAMWTKQFAALRDGDRFFYLNDPALRAIAEQFGIDYRQTLAQIVKLSAGVTVPADVFKEAG